MDEINDRLTRDIHTNADILDIPSTGLSEFFNGPVFAEFINEVRRCNELVQNVLLYHSQFKKDGQSMAHLWLWFVKFAYNIKNLEAVNLYARHNLLLTGVINQPSASTEHPEVTE